MGQNAGTEFDGMADINKIKPKETNNNNAEINAKMQDSRFAKTITETTRRDDSNDSEK